MTTTTPTRDRILDAARAELTTVGYASCTMASVRDRAGVSNGSLFHAYPTKAALAAAVYVDGMADYQWHAVEAIAEVEGTTALRRLVVAHLGWVEDHEALARFLFSTLPDEVTEHAVGPLADRNATFAEALTRCYDAIGAAGAMGPLDLATAHSIGIGPAQEYCRRWVRGSAPQPPRAVATVLADAAIAALAATATADPGGDHR